MGAEFEKQVSVIMGVYNQWNREALQKAVKSILNQTLTDFEFIIYDDGSDPEVAGYIRELEKLDERIVLIGKEENHGLAFSLNMCIGAAKGKYIARMDADDIALPERLQVQYDFMERHKDEQEKMYYFTTKAQHIYTEVQYPDGCWLLFGREDAGLPEELLVQHPARCLRFPMRQGLRSLNLSNSVAIGVYEALRQWDFPQLQNEGQLHRLKWE